MEELKKNLQDLKKDLDKQQKNINELEINGEICFR